MPRTSARLSSARPNDGRSATNQNQNAEANAAQALHPIQPLAPRGRKRVNIPTGSGTGEYGDCPTCSILTA